MSISSIHSSLSPPIQYTHTYPLSSNTQCISTIHQPLINHQNPYTKINAPMNPYVFNPYAIAAAANLAHYPSTNTQNTTTQIPTNPLSTTTTTTTNPYAVNATLAQAAALNAYTQNIAAVQQQLLTQQITNTTDNIMENDDNMDENDNKNKKNIQHRKFENL
eukprot:978748_1